MNHALLLAIAIVESSNNPMAVGDDGLSWGLYQIRPIYVQDVNRIVGYRKYRHEDAFDPALARQMVETYVGHYATTNRLHRPVTDMDRARIHNGGPNGYMKTATEEYWMKVRKEMQ